MLNALGAPQSLLLLGGTSDIALAVALAYSRRVRALRVVLAARDTPARGQAADRLRAAGCTVEEITLEATEPQDHAGCIARAAAGGDIDIAVVAYGILGDQETAWQDVDAGVDLARVNFVGPVATGVALGQQIRRQGHGVVVALSSVAGQRARRSNFVYGATKAGFDAFYTGLGEALREHGGRVLVVRPGFVRTSMTAGLATAPLSVTAEQVADAVLAAVDRGAEQVWVPSRMRAVMSVLTHLPRPVFRRLRL